MRPGQILARLWQSKGFIAFSGGICGASALGISLLLPDQYLATAAVQLEDVVYSDVQSYSVSTKQIDTYVRTQGEMARDFRVTGRVVDRLGWTGNYQLAQRYNEIGAASGLDFRSWLARGVRDGINLQYEEGNPVFQIGFAGSTPNEARVMAGVIRDEYIAYSLEKRRSDAENNAGWIDRQLENLTMRMRQLEERNAEFARANDIVMTPDGMSMAEVRLRNAASALEPQRQGSMSAALVANPAARQLTEVEAELARLSGSLGPNHPQILDLKNQREELRRMASAAVSPPSIPRMPDNNALTRRMEQEYAVKADDIATAKRYFDELEALRAQFQSLTQRREGFDLDAGTLQGGAIVAGDPKVRPGVFFPNRPFAVGVATVFGAMLAALLSLFIGLLNMKVATARDLELFDVERLGAPSQKKVRSKTTESGQSHSALPPFGHEPPEHRPAIA